MARDLRSRRAINQSRLPAIAWNPRTRPSRLSRRSGFTLLEVLLVVAILVAIAAIAVPNLIGVQESAKVSEAKLNVRQLYDGTKQFMILHQRFPTREEGLQVLSVSVNGKPVIMESVNLTDPWGVPYNYQYPGSKNNTGGPDVWSNGPDQQSGTADDVGNWNAGQK